MKLPWQSVNTSVNSIRFHQYLKRLKNRSFNKYCCLLRYLFIFQGWKWGSYFLITIRNFDSPIHHNHSWTKIFRNRMPINYTLPLLFRKVNDQKRMHMIKIWWGHLRKQTLRWPWWTAVFLTLPWQHCQRIFRNETPRLTSNREEEYGLWGNFLISCTCYASIKRIFYWDLWCSNQELKKCGGPRDENLA